MEPKTDLINLDSDEEEIDASGKSTATVSTVTTVSAVSTACTVITATTASTTSAVSNVSTISTTSTTSIVSTVITATTTTTATVTTTTDSENTQEIEDRNRIQQREQPQQQQLRNKVDNNVILRVLSNSKFPHSSNVRNLSGATKGIIRGNEVIFSDGSVYKTVQLSSLQPFINTTTNSMNESSTTTGNNTNILQRRRLIDIIRRQPRKKLTNKPNPTLIKQMELLRREQIQNKSLVEGVGANGVRNCISNEVVEPIKQIANVIILSPKDNAGLRKAAESRAISLQNNLRVPVGQTESTVQKPMEQESVVADKNKEIIGVEDEDVEMSDVGEKPKTVTEEKNDVNSVSVQSILQIENSSPITSTTVSTITAVSRSSLFVSSTAITLNTSTSVLTKSGNADEGKLTEGDKHSTRSDDELKRAELYDTNTTVQEIAALPTANESQETQENSKEGNDENHSKDKEEEHQSSMKKGDNISVLTDIQEELLQEIQKELSKRIRGEKQKILKDVNRNSNQMEGITEGSESQGSQNGFPIEKIKTQKSNEENDEGVTPTNREEVIEERSSPHVTMILKNSPPERVQETQVMQIPRDKHLQRPKSSAEGEANHSDDLLKDLPEVFLKELSEDLIRKLQGASSGEEKPLQGNTVITPDEKMDVDKEEGDEATNTKKNTPNSSNEREEADAVKEIATSKLKEKEATSGLQETEANGIKKLDVATSQQALLSTVQKDDELDLKILNVESLRTTMDENGQSTTSSVLGINLADIFPNSFGRRSSQEIFEEGSFLPMPDIVEDVKKMVTNEGQKMETDDGEKLVNSADKEPHF